MTFDFRNIERSKLFAASLPFRS